LVEPDQDVVADVLMTGLGTVDVVVLDAGGVPVRRAQVVFNSRSAFTQRLEGVTDDAGRYRFDPVLAGGFDVTAVENSTGLTGNVRSSVLAGETVEVTVHLESAGNITGRVLAPDGATPVRNIRVRVQPTGREAATDIEGRFRFNLLPVAAGPYRLEAYDGRGTLRATADGVALGAHGETVTRDLTLSGTGTVAGTVFDPDGVPVGAIAVSVDSDVPGMPTLQAVTDAEGSFAVEGIPEGTFRVTANDRARRLAGSANGRVSFDGEIVVIDVHTVADEIPVAPPGSGITTVTRLYDANNTAFAVQNDGSIRDGTASVFQGDNAGDRGGFRLTLRGSDGQRLPFESRGGRFELEGRQIALSGDGPDGLVVTRKIYVPRDGYFARYLEVLRNTTDQVVVVDVEVRTGFRSIQRTRNGFRFQEPPRVIATSSGDNTVFIGAQERDLWVTVDDDEDADPFLSTTLPTVAAVFDGQGDVIKRVDNAAFALGGDWGALETTWQEVVIQPGQAVTLMHFAVQQINRLGARAAAERLASSPAEAIFGLSESEIDTMLNFDLEAGQGIDPLPPLTGNLSGEVYESDEVTRVGSANVSFRSRNLLFGRTFGVRANGQGTYAYGGRLGNNGDSVPIPTDGFDVWATHPVTGAASDNAGGDWPDEGDAVAHIYFRGTGLIGGEVRRPNGDVVSTGTVRITGDGLNTTTPIAEDGRFSFGGLRPGNYSLTATLPVPGGTALTGTALANVVASETTPVLITIVPTGGASGIVHDGGGNEAINVLTEMRRNGFQRSQRTDTGGRYTFLDAPVEAYAVRAQEPTSGVWSEVNVQLVEGITVQQDIGLIPIGEIRLTATYPDGRPVADAAVHVRRDPVGNFFQGAGRTDALGRLTIGGVPRGNFVVRVFHPQNGNIIVDTPGAVENHRETVLLPVEVPNDDAPTVALTAPLDGAQYLEGASVVIAAAAQDDYGLRRVEFLVDGEVIGTDGSAPYQVVWQPPQGDGDRQYVITAVAVDNGPNRTTSDPVSITVRDDQVPPNVQLLQPFGGAAFIEGTTFAARADANDDIGVARVEFLLDGVVAATDESFPYSVNLTLAADAADAGDEVVVTARAIDRAGNAAEASRPIRVLPDQPPTINIVRAPADGEQVIEGTSVVLEADARDDVRVEVDLVVNGQVVQTRGQAPFRFTYELP
ncbi:MAG: carboxypeptidase regulatory-like domain-containing protein, partial [Myxococcales bacterium]|nr:carboxypeptidase regulatory-like domain-containing protein [Myxococcales bacterium]